MQTSIPFAKDLVARAEDKVIEVYLHAQSIWKQAFALPSVDFDLVGCCAGRAYYRENRIRLNPVLLAENYTDFIAETVPHEVAHLLAFTLHGRQTRVKPHGPEWKSVVLALGLRPVRCHNYDVTNAQVRHERRYTYACRCREVREFARTHNRIQRGEIFFTCNYCNSRFAHREGEAGQSMT